MSYSREELFDYLEQLLKDQKVKSPPVRSPKMRSPKVKAINSPRSKKKIVEICDADDQECLDRLFEDRRATTGKINVCKSACKIPKHILDCIKTGNFYKPQKTKPRLTFEDYE